MDTNKVFRWLAIFLGPIGWSIAGIYYAALLRHQYCEIRKSKKQIIR